MKRKIAVFGTRHITAERPVFSGQEPVHELWHHGQCLRWYSTGKLEEAIAEGYEIYVVSIRPVFGPHDAWWRSLVDPANILHTAGPPMVRHPLGPMAWVFTPWKELYRRLGVPWDDRYDDFDDPYDGLIACHGIQGGDSFVGMMPLN